MRNIDLINAIDTLKGINWELKFDNDVADIKERIRFFKELSPNISKKDLFNILREEIKMKFGLFVPYMNDTRLGDSKPKRMFNYKLKIYYAEQILNMFEACWEEEL